MSWGGIRKVHLLLNEMGSIPSQQATLSKQHGGMLESQFVI